MAMDFLRNVNSNLKATSVATVVCVWMVCVTVTAVFGETGLGEMAFGTFCGVGFVLLLILGCKAIEARPRD